MSEEKIDLKQIINQEDNRERMRLVVDAFNQAMEDEDHDIAREVATYVVHNEHQGGFGAGFQFHCLRWLTHHYHFRYSHSEDGSQEEEQALVGLQECIELYDWLIQKLPRDISITREEIQAANDFMLEIYQEFQFDTDELQEVLLEQAMLIGDAQAAQTHFAAWQTFLQSNPNGCQACRQDVLVQYYDFIGDYQQAITAAQPILSGELSCNVVPQNTYEYVIHSLIALNRREEAEEILYQAIDLIKKEEDDTIYLPMLIYYFTQLDLKHEASDLLDEYADEIIEFGANNRLNYLEYLISVAPFNDEALTAAQEVAKQFDERNGNSFYQDKLAFMFQKITLH